MGGSCSNGGEGRGSEVCVGVGEALELLLVYGGQHVGVGRRQHRRGHREELVEIFPLFPALLEKRRLKKKPQPRPPFHCSYELFHQKKHLAVMKLNGMNGSGLMGPTFDP